MLPLHLVNAAAPARRVVYVHASEADILRALTLLENILDDAQRIAEEAGRRRTLNELADREKDLGEKLGEAEGDAAVDKESAARQREITDELTGVVNVPEGDLVQFLPALGAAVLGHQRVAKLASA